MSKPIRELLRESLHIEPDTRKPEELTPEEQEFRKATDDFYQGKGFPLHLFKKHYQRNLSIHPDPKQLTTLYH